MFVLPRYKKGMLTFKITLVTISIDSQCSPPPRRTCACARDVIAESSVLAFASLLAILTVGSVRALDIALLTWKFNHKFMDIQDMIELYEVSYLLTRYSYNI